MPTEEEQLQRYFNYFISIGLPEEMATSLAEKYLAANIPDPVMEKIASRVSQIDMTGRTDDELKNILANYAVQVTRVEQSALASFIPETPTLAEIPAWRKWRPFDEESFYTGFLSEGISEERSRELAVKLSQYEVPDTSALTEGQAFQFVTDYQDWVERWIDSALEAEAKEKEEARVRAVVPFMALQAQEEVRREIEGERARVQQLKPGYKGTARVLREKQAEAQRRWAEAQGQMPSATAVSAPFLETLHPERKQFFKSELADVFQEQDMSEARRKWWEQRTQFPGFEPSGIGGADWWKLSDEELEEMEEPQVKYQEKIARQKALSDPWQIFLEGYPFKEKWKGLTPRQRGEQEPSTRQFRPRTRVLR